MRLNGLNNYHLKVYKNLKKYMNKFELIELKEILFKYLKFYTNLFR